LTPESVGMPCWESGGGKGCDGRTIGFPTGRSKPCRIASDSRQTGRSEPIADETSKTTKAGMTRLVRCRSKSPHRPARIPRAISGSARNPSTIVDRTIRRAHHPERSQID
jgi:hypothetical protein